MYLEIAVDVAVAMLAVFGLYSIVRLILQRFFVSDNLVIAIELNEPEDIANAEALIREALMGYFFVGIKKVAVIVPQSVAQNKELLETLGRYGVYCYVIGE